MILGDPVPHQHGLGHHHSREGLSDWRLAWAITANVLLTVAQIIGGVMANSLALVADALHNLNDAASLVLALVARRIGRRAPDKIRTFGYRKAPVIGALVNLTSLIIVGLYLIYEAITRFFDQPEVGGWIIVIVAGIALIVDIVTALLIYSMSKESLNIKAAFIHNVSDALASVGVMVAGTLIILFDWYWTDLVVTLAISAYILHQGTTMIGGAIRVLMDSAPKAFDLSRMVEDVKAINQVRDIHHVHVWHLDEERVAFEAHILVVDNVSMSQVEELKRRIKEMLRERYHIDHATLEIEIGEIDEHDTRLLVG